MTTTMDPDPPPTAARRNRPGVRREMRPGVVAMPMTFDELYRGRYRSMVRLAYVLVDTSEDAEQVVQDVFIGYG